MPLISGAGFKRCQLCVLCEAMPVFEICLQSVTPTLAHRTNPDTLILQG